MLSLFGLIYMIGMCTKLEGWGFFLASVADLVMITE